VDSRVIAEKCLKRVARGAKERRAQEQKLLEDSEREETRDSDVVKSVRTRGKRFL